MAFANSWVETDPDGAVITGSLLDDHQRLTKRAVRERLEGDPANPNSGVFETGSFAATAIVKAGSARAYVVTAANLGTLTLQDGRIAITSDTNRMYHLKGSGLVELAYAPLSGAVFTGDITLANGKFLYGTRTTGSAAVRLFGYDVGTDDITTVLGGTIWRVRDTGAGVYMSLQSTNGGLLTVGPSPGAISSTLETLIVQGTSAVANDLTIAGPATAQMRIFFSKPGSVGRGEISYNMATDGMRFVVSGAIVTTVGSTGVWTFPAGISATVLTAAQPNITSLGTLSSVLIISTPNQAITFTGAGVAAQYIRGSNTGGDFFLGLENSAGGSPFAGGGVYATVFGSINATSLQFATNNTIRQTIDSAGNVVFASGDLIIPATKRFYVDGGGDTYITEGTGNSLQLFAGGIQMGVFSTTYASFGGDIITIPTSKIRVDGSPIGDTYIYEVAANIMDFYAGGTRAFVITSTNTNSLVDHVISATKRLYLDGGGDTYIYESTANVMRLTAGGNNTLTVTSTDVQVNPLSKYFVDGGGDTYIVESAANTFDIVAGGTNVLRLTTTLALVNNNIPLAVAATAKLYLDGGGNTYIQESSADNLVIVVGGVAGIIQTATAINFSNLATITGATVYNGAVNGNLTGTIQTAAQPNITSVGTLVSLGVTGTVTAGLFSGPIQARSVNVTLVGTGAAVVDTDLMSHVLPALANGDTVEIIATGEVQGANNTKLIKFWIGASTLDQYIVAAGGVGRWHMRILLTKDGASTHTSIMRSPDGFTTGVLHVTRFDAVELSGATVKITGQTTNAADEVTQETMIVTITKA